MTASPTGSLNRIAAKTRPSTAHDGIVHLVAVGHTGTVAGKDGVCYPMWVRRRSGRYGGDRDSP